MPTIEKLLSLRNGPPWGFRLQENGGLIVYRIRKKSPADEAGLQEGDKVLSLNNVSTSSMNHSDAVQFISEFSQSQLNMKVSRQESKATFQFEPSSAPVPFETDFSSAKFDTKLVNKENNKPTLTAPVLKPFMVETSTPKPFISQQQQQQKAPEPKVVQPAPPLSIKPTNYQPTPVVRAPPVVVQPTYPCDDGFEDEDDDEEEADEPYRQQVTPVDVNKLMREYSVPEIDPYLKKKQYSDSSFYSANNQYFPTVDEQMQLARNVAASLTEPSNLNSAGARMFEKRRRRMDKWTVTNDDEDYPSQGSVQLSDSNSESLSGLLQTSQDRQHPGPQGWSSGGIPMAPPPPTTYIEKVKAAPKTKHDQVNPATCFDIASALHNSGSRGAQIFAKKKARSKKWEVEPTNPVAPPPQLIHQLVPQMAPGMGPNKQKLPTKLGGSGNAVSTATLPLQAAQAPRTAMGWQDPYSNYPEPNHRVTTSNNIPTSGVPSEPREWKPVQFKIPQKT